ncbi:hypothetical protein RJ641_021300 [Dillenia turbinata]|uniref:EGF-like domain-containing protein n=1 Tax=Dillenia turbinata TaxID=194707 RepID=A0AAN8YST0_9MAGN
MASPPTFATLLLILPILRVMGSVDEFLSPLLSPIVDDVCKEIYCGKGNCKAESNATFFFVCECDAGWKQTLDSDLNSNLRFLPCVIPNCTLDYTCQNTNSSYPAQTEEKPTNTSVFDPCYWTYCGGGTCNRTSRFALRCECSEGYANLLNTSYFPCFRDCSFGVDCKNLGFSVSNNSISSTPTSSEVKNEGSSLVQSRLHWTITLLIYLGMVAWT